MVAFLSLLVGLWVRHLKMIGSTFSELGLLPTFFSLLTPQTSPCCRLD